MKKFILSLIFIVSILFANGQYSYLTDSQTQFGYTIPPNVYVFDLDQEKWFLVEVQQSSTATISDAISANQGHYVETGGSSPVSSTGGNYVNFTGTTTGSAQDNTDSLTLAFSRADEVFIRKGTYSMAMISVPPNKSLKFERGAILDFGTDTIYGANTMINAGQYQIFTTVSGLAGTWQSYNNLCPIEWLGAKGDGTGTVDAYCIEKSLNVFNKRIDYDDQNRFPNYTSQNTVTAFGTQYNLEQTIESPEFANFSAGIHTTLVAADGFFGSFWIQRLAPYYIKGGRWLCRKYFDQDGYNAITTPDYQDRLDYSYNKNPMFLFYFRNKAFHSANRTDETYARMWATQRDFFLGYSGSQYNESDLDQLPYRFDGIFVIADTSYQTSGKLESARYYRIVDYKAGDDFSNLNEVGTNPGSAGEDGMRFRTSTYDYGYYEPNNWTNGTVVRNSDNGTRYRVWDNFKIHQADTAILLKGDQLGEDVNGNIFSNYMSDGSTAAIVILNDANSNDFQNLYVQMPRPTLTGVEEIPVIDIGSSMNYFDGRVMDADRDNVIKIHAVQGQGFPTGNTVDITTENNILQEYYTTIDGGMPSSNDVGAHPMFYLISDSTVSGKYWFKGYRMGVVAQNVEQFNRYVSPVAVFNVIGADDIYGDVLSIFQPQSEAGGGQSGDIKTTYAMHEAICISPKRVNGLPYGGFGARISFNMQDSTLNSKAQNDNYKMWELGSIGFRNQQLQTMSASGLARGVFQIWNTSEDTEGVFVERNQMTIQHDGKMGLLGVTRPEATIDMIGNVNNVSGTINSNTSIKIDRVKLEPYDTSGTLPSGELGDLMCGQDGTLLFHNGTAWQNVDLTPRP